MAGLGCILTPGEKLRNERLFDVPLHNQPGLEYNNFFRRHGHFLAGAGISSQAAAAGLDLKYSKVSELNRLAFRKIVRNFIQSALHNSLYINLLDARFIGNLKHDIFLGNGHNSSRKHVGYYHARTYDVKRKRSEGLSEALWHVRRSY
jgi:hypothetical protein